MLILSARGFVFHCSITTCKNTFIFLIIVEPAQSLKHAFCDFYKVFKKIYSLVPVTGLIYECFKHKYIMLHFAWPT